MIQIIHLKNDLKQILRDPVMAIMLFAPLILITVFKLLIIFLIPYINNKTGLNLSLYSQYILAFVLLVSTGMLGIVTGFMMLDDRDGNIVQLMSVTPLGRGGYLVNRLLLASFASCIYCFLSCYGLSVVKLPLYTILFLSALSALYAAITGLLIYTGAKDKVNGLTFAKALNALVLFAFTDLFSLPWLTVISWFFPAYWIAAIIKTPHHLITYALAILVHIAWLALLIRNFWYKRD